MKYDTCGRYANLSNAVKETYIGCADIIKAIKEGDNGHIAHSLFYYDGVICAGDKGDTHIRRYIHGEGQGNSHGRHQQKAFLKTISDPVSLSGTGILADDDRQSFRADCRAVSGAVERG